ncbi:MAG: hypothetical protein HQM09_14720 [Candidatus Riflebacteria bacterium]|nr:hypothetical protein [Candidatus Riflebacteria bacterium]
MTGMLSMTSLTILCVCLAILMSGCAAESGNPLGTQNIGSGTKLQESMVLDLDARGYVNGKFFPSTDPHYDAYFANYWGKWNLATAAQDTYYMMSSSTPGDRVDIVGTYSRAVFEFYDYQMYANPGNVRFSLDGRLLGDFNLARKDPNGNKIIEYVVSTGKTTVATISMSIVSGTAMISGYFLVIPDSPQP